MNMINTMLNLFNNNNTPTTSEDIPLVLKKEELDNLEIKKYYELTEEQKKKNPSDIIKLEKFNESEIFNPIE